MKTFIDSSSLLKKYYFEDGTDRLFKILEKTDEIVVSAVTYVEINNTLKKLFVEQKLKKEEYVYLANQINKDFPFFTKIK